MNSHLRVKQLSHLPLTPPMGELDSAMVLIGPLGPQSSDMNAVSNMAAASAPFLRARRWVESFPGLVRAVPHPPIPAMDFPPLP